VISARSESRFRVLYAIAQEQPKRLSDLAEITGVGRTKLENYGEEVIALVREG
jgi:superfamily II DNA helicase RecQ